MMERYDGFEESYVTKHFRLLAFTELQRKQGFSTNPPKGLVGNWIGVKNMMCRATLDLTTKGRLETPCVMYHDTDTSLILEIVDVRRVSWPEPGLKDNSNWPKKSSAKTALVTPRIPLVVVRYSYMETGLAKDGAQFLSHLQSRLRWASPQIRYRVPRDNPPWCAKRRMNEQTRLRQLPQRELSPSGFRAGDETPKEHIRMFARLLSYNADFVDKEWADDQQSHWNIPAKVKTEMRLSGSRTPSTSPARAYIAWTLDFGIASEQETVKMGTPSVYGPPRNQYGAERFICRAGLADAGQGEWDPN
ncbi:hypothetical protein B0H14DRAFT_3876000 [Mycena olivaceomarginata]|nr:hypothetical protein B0H14DRAFT_3876000 [Mycena olivaceomarginata]